MPRRPNRWPRNGNAFRKATGEVLNCWGTFCRWYWHAWEWAWYNLLSQGSRLPLEQVRGPRTPSVPKGRTLRKVWRSLGSPTPDTAPWGNSPDLPVWRDGDRTTGRGRFVKPVKALLDSLMKP